MPVRNSLPLRLPLCECEWVLFGSRLIYPMMNEYGMEIEKRKYDASTHK